MTKKRLFVVLVVMIPLVILWLYAFPWILNTKETSKESSMVLLNLKQEWQRMTTHIQNVWHNLRSPKEPSSPLKDLERELLKIKKEVPSTPNI